MPASFSHAYSSPAPANARKRRALLIAAVAAATLVVASQAPARSAAPVARTAVTHATHASEVARIRVHFDSVLNELRLANVTHLSDAQRSARNAHIAELAAYRNRGVFPHNHDFAESWMPYFVDHRGVLCAVAHLLEASGRQDIVARVAAEDNNVWVADLAGDAEFARWLDRSGLTLAEAARIQVPYMETVEEPSASRSNRVNSAVAFAASGLGAAAIAWNTRNPADGNARLRSALGYTAGAMGLAVAASRRDAEGVPLAIGAVAGTIGLGSVIMATQTLLGSRAANRAAAAPREDNRAAVSIAPSVQAVDSRLAPAVTFNVRF